MTGGDGGSGEHLVTHAEHKQTVEHHRVGRNFADLARAQDSCRGCAQKGGRVEKVFGTELLEHPDQHVCQCGYSEQAVLPTTEEQEHDRASADDRIEQGEQVGTKNVPEAPTRSPGQRVDHAGAHSSVDFAAIQPADSKLCDVHRSECRLAGSGHMLRARVWLR